MKKPLIIVIVLIIIGLLVWYFGGDKAPSTTTDGNATSTIPASSSAPVSETTKVSDKLSEYKNEELGFSVKYPSAWDLSPSDATITLYIPMTKATSNTIKRLDAKIAVTSGKCTFPPVTTIKDRSTLVNGTLSFNMISMANSVQGSNYFDRMYSIQKDAVCYTFTFSSITGSTAALKGSEATQVANNNKAIVEAADTAFIAMVKSFAYVVGPVGKDEASVVPTKK